MIVFPAVFGGFIYGYVSLLEPHFIWGWLWFLLFIWFFYSKQDVGSRGWIFLCASLLLAVGGKAYFTQKHPNIDKDVVEMFYQLMLIAGGSIGASFVAHAPLEKKQR
ncbi:hypothetical protein [Luteimonas fraxinea]|uniref:hypothetical protein n=1 Tax=Luteimonas fraxinea TaxID=2901869 RepID=UPI001E3F59CC|nr:hypothetical protein [Luteimonas fraxinea]MCD9126629.1 hypothetical protein [Luteimonas fraxinea]